MSECGKCHHFFKSGENADDNAGKNGNCVMEKSTDKVKYWISKPIMTDSQGCPEFKPFMKVA